MMSFVLAAGLLAGCTYSFGPPGQPPSRPGETGPAETPSGSVTSFPYYDGYVREHLHEKTDYTITYRMLYFEGIADPKATHTHTATYTHTLDGGYYFYTLFDDPNSRASGERLFTLSAGTDKYDTYKGTAATGFKRATTATATQAEVDEAAADVGGQMTSYLKHTSPMEVPVELMGTEELLGRQCDKYVRAWSGKETRTYDTWWIEPDTGVVLKYEMVGEYSNTGERYMHTVITATEFKTGGDVKLPEHD